jgi:DNA mismatch endonuclease (patch repair protein)
MSSRTAHCRDRLTVDASTSARLGRVRQRGTAPELLVRDEVCSLHHAFRVNNRDLAGSPDIANRRKKWAIFVHGCFWHRHTNCSRTTTPKRNREFWMEKFASNRRRDRRNIKALNAQGFCVLIIWECETEDAERRKAMLSHFFQVCGKRDS